MNIQMGEHVLRKAYVLGDSISLKPRQIFQDILVVMS